MQNIFYFRTWQDGSQETHLSHNCDTGICGIDLFGDNTVHDRQPEQLEGVNHRVTCRGCQHVIATVKAHLTKRAADKCLQCGKTENLNYHVVCDEHDPFS